MVVVLLLYLTKVTLAKLFQHRSACLHASKELSNFLI